MWHWDGYLLCGMFGVASCPDMTKKTHNVEKAVELTFQATPGLSSDQSVIVKYGQTQLHDGKGPIGKWKLLLFWTKAFLL